LALTATAAETADTLYISGCLALDETGTFLGGDAAAQAKQALSNLGKVLAAARARAA
jgi:enamine deaminase RidA (YjgF/YER057c/UK114 family)